MYFMGLDLGQAADYTALAICDDSQPVEQYVDAAGMLRTKPAGPAVYKFTHIQRYALGTSYPEIVQRLMLVVRDPRLMGNYVLVVDATGVGAPVVDMLRDARLNIVPAVITSGTEASWSGGSWHVPKRVLVSNLSVLIQEKRALFSGKMPEVTTFVNEMLNFKVKISAAGHDSYEAWREGVHDDLVLATALACWWAEKSNVRLEVY